MKRVKAACICLTPHFMRKEELGQTVRPLLKLIKQYHQSPVGEYSADRRNKRVAKA